MRLHMMHGNRWLIPAMLLVGLAGIVVWGLLRFIRYREAENERQGKLDWLKGLSSRESDKEE